MRIKSQLLGFLAAVLEHVWKVARDSHRGALGHCPRVTRGDTDAYSFD